MIRGYSAPVKTDSLINFLRTVNGEDVRLLLVSLLIQNNGISEAQLILNNGISTFSHENAAYSDYFNILINLKQNEKEIYELDSTQKATLMQIAYSEFRISQAAKSILNWFYNDTQVWEPESLPMIASHTI